MRIWPAFRIIVYRHPRSGTPALHIAHDLNKPRLEGKAVLVMIAFVKGGADHSTDEASRQKVTGALKAKDSDPGRRQHDARIGIGIQELLEHLTVLEQCMPWSIYADGGRSAVPAHVCRMQHAIEVQVENLCGS